MPEIFSENMNNRYDNLNIRFQHMQHKKNRCLPQQFCLPEASEPVSSYKFVSVLSTLTGRYVLPRSAENYLPSVHHVQSGRKSTNVGASIHLARKDLFSVRRHHAHVHRRGGRKGYGVV